MTEALATPATVATQAALAAALGETPSRISQLGKEGRLVKAPDGGWDVEATRQRIAVTSNALGRAGEQIQGEDYANAQARERWYSAELKRLELDRELGRVRDAAEVEAVARDAATLVRGAIESWRDRMPPQLAACGADEQRIASLLATECDHLLHRLAERLATLAGQSAHPAAA